MRARKLHFLAQDVIHVSAAPMAVGDPVERLEFQEMTTSCGSGLSLILNLGFAGVSLPVSCHSTPHHAVICSKSLDLPILSKACCHWRPQRSSPLRWFHQQM